MIGQSYPFMPVLVLFAHDFTEHFVVAGSIGFWSNTWNNAWSVESLECMEQVINDLGIHLHSWETCYSHTFHHTHISTDYYFFKLLLFKRIICTLKLWKKKYVIVLVQEQKTISCTKRQFWKNWNFVLRNICLQPARIDTFAHARPLAAAFH